MPNVPEVWQRRSTFRRECGVRAELSAPPSRIWSLLTDAPGFPRWNSTVKQIEGPIAPGQRLKVKVPISPRTFTPKVTAYEPESRMVWSDGAAPFFTGVRTYTLTPIEGGRTRFEMVEIFSGLMLPMIAPSLPDFGPPFLRYAYDLQQEAEGARP